MHNWTPTRSSDSRKLAGLYNTWETILRDRGVWLDSVTALERKVAEVQMKRLIESERVKIIDPATTPERPSQPNWPVSLGIALAAGLLGGLLLAALAVYLGESEPSGG